MTEANSAASQPEPSGNGCDSSLITGIVTDFLKSLFSKDCLKIILDAGSHILQCNSKHLKILSEINEFLGNSKTTHMMDVLKSDLVAVQNALSILFDKVDILFCLMLNNDTKQSVITALENNDVAPLMAYLTKVQLAINKFIEAYKEFLKVCEPLEDSLKQRCQQCDHYLSTVEYNKYEIKCSRWFWGALFGVAALSLIVSLAAAGGFSAVGAGLGIMAGLGIGTTTVCAIGTIGINWCTCSKFSSVDCQLKKMHTGLCHIMDKYVALKIDAREVHNELQKCSSKIDVILQVCEEQGQVKILNMLDDLTDITKKLKSKQAEVKDKQK